MLTLQAVGRALGYDEAALELLRTTGWEHSQDSFAGVPEFLRMPFLAHYFPKLGLDDDWLPAFAELARKCETNLPLQLLAHHLHTAWFRAPDSPGWRLGALPEPVAACGELAGLFSLAVAMSACPLIEQTHCRLGIPPEYAEGTCRWIGGTTIGYRAAHGGRPGHDLRQTFWLRHSIDGRLFRIGRFEFMIEEPAAWLPAIYRRDDGRTIALCRDRWTLDQQGFRVSPQSPEARVCARLREDGGGVHGIPIHPAGYAEIGREITLDPAVWKPALAPWELALGLHIPAGGGMTPEAALDSLNAALDFFPRYFQRLPKVIECESWILNPDWQRELPDSHLSAFQRELYLFPREIGNGRDGLFFLFGRDDGDPATYPADNSVRRAMLKLLREGHPLKSGGMFLFPEDLPRFGSGIYREHPGKQEDR